MAAAELLTIDELRQLVRYDPDSGVVFWLPRTVEHYANCAPQWREGVCYKFNRNKAGKPAGGCYPNGYVGIEIRGREYKAHRVAWALVHGEWPTHDIDHRDGNRENNRIKNLRLAPGGINQRNAACRKDSRSGLSGVTWNKRKQKWRVRLKVDKVMHHFGAYSDLEQAKVVALEKRRELGFTERSGHPPAPMNGPSGSRRAT